MARRRRLEPPTSADLADIRAAAAADLTPRGGGEGYAVPVLHAALAPPIAQVAADSASAQRQEIDALRSIAGAAERDSARLKTAERDGLLMVDAPLSAIDVDFLSRDRMSAVVEDDGWRALKASIQANGQRTPVELTPLDGDPLRYGLISGYRRLAVLKRLHAETGEPRWAHARAILRAPATLAQAFLGMVEENEIRESLSYFERGRVCLRAAEQGAFASAEAALETLFASASPAKRSKIRSFVLIVEELGDLLAHPRAIGERLGLRVAQALRAGHGGAFRRVIADRGAVGEAAELAMLGACLDCLRDGDGRALRSRAPAPVRTALPDGGVLVLRRTRQGATLQIVGRAVSDHEAAQLKLLVAQALGVA